jgi:hypothetical protein
MGRDVGKLIADETKIATIRSFLDLCRDNNRMEFAIPESIAEDFDINSDIVNDIIEVWRSEQPSDGQYI